MQIGFVDQGNGLSMKRVRHVRIGYGHAPGKIADHCERALLAVRELIDDQLLSGLVYDHTERRASHAKLAESRKEAFDGGSHRLKLRVAIPRPVTTELVLQVFSLPEPLEEQPEAAWTSRECQVIRGQPFELMSLADTKRDVENGTIDRIVYCQRESRRFVLFQFRLNHLRALLQLLELGHEPSPIPSADLRHAPTENLSSKPKEDRVSCRPDVVIDIRFREEAAGIPGRTNPSDQTRQHDGRAVENGRLAGAIHANKDVDLFRKPQP